MESTINLKALLVEREDCDAGTVRQLRNGLAQGGNQYRSLKEVSDILKKKLEGAPAGTAKKWHLKLGIAFFFLGHLGEAVQHLQQAEGAVAFLYLGRALASRQEYDEALKAAENRASSQVRRGPNQGRPSPWGSVAGPAVVSATVDIFPVLAGQFNC